MKFSYVLLAAFLITSCNDGIKLNPIDQEIKNEIAKEESNIEEVSDCLNNLKPECMSGKWILQSMKLNEQEMSPTPLNLTESQKDQYIEVIGDKISGKIFLVKEDDVSLTDDPIMFNNIDYTLIKDKEVKKIRFQINQTKIESTIKNIDNHILILSRSGKTKSKNYIIETVWKK